MLQIKKRHHFSLPSFAGTHPLVMSPVRSENDELIREIDDDQSSHDDNWTLDAAPDTQELSRYWNTVEQDLRSDPEWVNFAEE